MIDRLRQLFARPERPVYAVGGFMRSGTTMMMQLLEAGGLTVDRAPEGDPAREDYELSKRQLRAGWPILDPEPGDLADNELPYGQRFPYAHRGHLIKTPVGASRYCDPMPAGYVVAYMHRDAEAIIDSQRRRWGRANRPDDIAAAVAHDRGVWERDDCPVAIVDLDYDAVLADPAGAVRQLIAAGFPIRHAQRAAAVVDPLRQARRWPEGVVA